MPHVALCKAKEMSAAGSGFSGGGEPFFFAVRGLY